MTFQTLKGSITVFLSLLLSSVLVFSLVLLESARVSSFRLIGRMAAETSVDSLFSCFNEDLFSTYHLFFLDSNLDDTKEEMVENYILDNMSSDLFRGSFYKASDVSVRSKHMTYATDENGEVFIKAAVLSFPYSSIDDLLENIEKSLTQVKRAEGKRKSIINQIESEMKKDEKEIRLSPESDLSDLENVLPKGLVFFTDPVEVVVPDKEKISDLAIPVEKEESYMLFNGNSNISIFDKVIFNEYLLYHFDSFIDDAEAHGLKYRLEYLLNGNPTDRKNLKSTVDTLLLIRIGMNLLTIESDEKLKDEARLLGDLLVSWTGNPSLMKLSEAFVTLLYAYTESIVDVRTLYYGKKVPLLKSKEDWVVRLENIPSFLKKDTTFTGSSKTGLTYEEYLRLFLFVMDEHLLSKRAMHLIDIHMREYNPSFSMDKSLYSAEFQIDITAKELFSSLPIRKKWYEMKKRYHFEGIISKTYLS